MRSFATVFGLAVLTASAQAGVTIIKDGGAQAAVYADPAVMSEEAVKGETWPEQEAEKARVLLRESIKDLAGVLERISGAKLPVVTEPPPRKSKTIAILVGKPAADRFGKPKKHSPFVFGFFAPIRHRRPGRPSVHLQ